MPRVLSHDAYTIAWISALPLEMAAAKLMLDEIHGNLTQPSTDHNCYTLGSIHGHNIVIACLPSGVYGTISATTVLAQMLPTFRSIKFGLMVGIGGGVPTKGDVRLGDVVVGIPSGSSGGVIQFDFGKTRHSGRFQRVGSLNKPPQVLLTAVSQLRSAQLMGEGEIPLMRTISEALGEDGDAPGRNAPSTRGKAIRTTFSRPHNDRLFDSLYTHVGPETDCSLCDPAKLVQREPRHSDAPRIHYGSIASGNQVMKDATTRDSIAQELDICCFEMEAAGLMDQLPCLVVRGICDYCDSHKSKEWQGYAALTAAAYAKTLLQVVPVPQNDRKAGKSHWMVPFSRNAAFVGRKSHIAALEDGVLRSAERRKTAICGLGGIGKTQIALELAYRVRDKSPEMSVFWIPCTSYESVEQAYMNIAQMTGMPELNAGAVKEQVKTYLSHERSGKWLLIYDNADDMHLWTKETETRPPLKSLLPHNEAGNILFTSRNRKLAVKLALSNVVQIPDMDEDTAMQMLQKHLIRKDMLEDKEATTTLLQQLCFLPLAISQAAAYLNENDITTLGSYLSLLDAQEENMVKLLSEDFEDDGRYADMQNPVTTTWLVSFSQIQLLDRLAVDYLSFMACISPRNIPQSLLPPALSHKKRIEALGILKAYSFISEETKSGDLTLHRLVYLATRTWMKKNKSFTTWILKTVQHMSQTFSQLDHRERNLRRQYLPHILSVIENNEFRSVRDQYGGLLQSVGYWLGSDGRNMEAKSLLSQVLEDREKTLGKDHEDTLDIMDNLGEVLLELGQYTEAKQIMEQVLEGRNVVLGPEHPDTLSSLEIYSWVFAGQGEYARAQEIRERTLQGFEKVLGPEHLSTLDCLAGLGSILVQLGQYEDAAAIYGRVMDGYVKELGPQHEDTLHTVSNTGVALTRLGKYDEAEQIHLEVLRRSEETYGAEHWLPLTSMDNLGNIYLEQERFEEAEELRVRALRIAKRLFGAEHPDTLVIIDQLGIVLGKQGRHGEAKCLHQLAITGSNKHLGEDHPLTISFLGNLAMAHWEQGQLEEAEELEVRVWETKKQKLGLEHPSTLRSMQNLAYTRESMGKRREAIDLTKECLELRTKRLGPEHPDTVDSKIILSRWQEIESRPRADQPATALDCGNQTSPQADDDGKSVPIPLAKKGIVRAATGDTSDTPRVPISTEAGSRWKVWRRLRHKMVTS
jgi:nucleoside phosphorylase/tetratricopeptide (TPR) repeat protein